MRGVLLKRANDVSLHRVEVSAASPMNFTFLVSVSYQDSPVYVNSVLRQMRFQHGVREGLFRLAFGKKVEACHQ